MRPGAVLSRIVSGGQTGVDRAALEAARAAGVRAGGWVPKGRWAEDGRVPDGLGELRETESADPAERTRRNVADTDGTLIVSHGPLEGGSALTREEALQLARRTFRRWRTREELWNGNLENSKAAFWGGDALFPWAIRSHFRHRAEWPSQLAGRRLVRLRNAREVEAWLAQTVSAGSA